MVVLENGCVFGWGPETKTLLFLPFLATMVVALPFSKILLSWAFPASVVVLPGFGREREVCGSTTDNEAVGFRQNPVSNGAR